MTRITWGDPGTKFFETGIDQGVLYVDSAGYAWNGLTAVTEKPSGGEAQPFYADGLKYLNLSSAEEFEATIEAFGAPPEFGPCDGTRAIYNGLFVGQQPRKAFGFTYRTLVGNDALGKNYGYKIHLIWNALAKPTERAYSTTNDSPEGVAMSWDITTLPPSLTGYKPTAYMEIDSRFTPRGLLKAIEDILYGSDAAAARLPFQSELMQMFLSEGPLTRTNWVPNPSFRTVLPAAENRRNLSRDPAASGVTLVDGTLGWAANWFGASGAGTNSTVTGTGPLGTSTTYFRKTWTTGSAVGDTAFAFAKDNTKGYPVVAGDTYTVSAYVRTSASGKSFAIRYRLFDSAGTLTNVYGPYVTAAPNTWVRVSYTYTMPAGTVYMAPWIDDKQGATAWVAGDTLDGTMSLIEKSPRLDAYFDGSTPAAGPYKYSWISAVNNSQSIRVSDPELRRNLNPNPFYKDAGTPGYEIRRNACTAPDGGALDRWSVNGASLSSSGGELVATMTAVGVTYLYWGWGAPNKVAPAAPGEVWTASMDITGSTADAVSLYICALDANGVQIDAPSRGFGMTAGTKKRISFTRAALPANTAYISFAISLPGKAVGDTMKVSKAILEKTANELPYFDGNTATADWLTYSWTGTANASASIASGTGTPITSVWGYLRKSWKGIGTAPDGSDTSLSYIGQDSSTLLLIGNQGSAYPNDIVALRLKARLRNSSTNVDVTPGLYAFDGTNTGISLFASGAKVTLPSSGAWMDLVVPGGTAPANTVTARPYITTSSPLTTPAIIEIALVLEERVTMNGELPKSHFGGSSPASDGVTYWWSGTPNGSESFATVKALNGWNIGAAGKAFYQTSTSDGQGGYFGDVRGYTISYMNPPGTGAVGEYWAARATIMASPDTPAGSTFRLVIHDGVDYVTTTSADGSADTYIPVPSQPTEIVAYSRTPLQGTAPRLYVYPGNSSQPVRVAKAIMEKVSGPGMAPGPFFDGSTPAGGKYFYHWDGTPDASTSHVNTWN